MTLKRTPTDEIKRDIAKLAAEFEAEVKANGYTKRAIFLEATINVYANEVKKRSY